MMSVDKSHIPTEVYVGILGRTIEIHWEYHAVLMFSVWMVLAPLFVTVIRYGKPRPTLKGVQTRIALRNREWWWFNTHKYGFFVVVFLALAGATVALLVSGGFSGSAHSVLGLLTIALACLQVISALLRGTHGGKYYYTADPGNPSTWAGDHYSRTTRRRVFEAYHKTTGYLTGYFAFGAVASGLIQYPMPVLAALAIAVPFLYLAIWVVLEFLERRYDGYRAVHGYGLEHPYNKEREFL